MDTLQFLELSVPARQVRESLAWYLELGFSQHETGEIRTYNYAVVSAGPVHVGLHAANIETPALSFVRPEVARYVRRRELEGGNFAFTRLGVDQFHEAGMTDPDGTQAIIMEARSFTRAANDEHSEPLTGTAGRISLPCLSLHDAVEFWQEYGFMAVETEGDGVAELHSADLTIELREGARQVALIFEPPDLALCLDKLATAGIDARPTRSGHELTAPEGTRLLLRERP